MFKRPSHFEKRLELNKLRTLLILRYNLKGVNVYLFTPAVYLLAGGSPVTSPQADIVDVTETFSCASRAVTVVTRGASVLECGARCLLDPDCVLFATESKDGTCAVTGGERTDVRLQEIYERLYALRRVK